MFVGVIPIFRSSRTTESSRARINYYSLSPICCTSKTYRVPKGARLILFYWVTLGHTWVSTSDWWTVGTFVWERLEEAVSNCSSEVLLGRNLENLPRTQHSTPS